MFEILFSVQFLLKILLIVAIVVLMNGQLKIDVDVYHRGSVDIGSETGGGEIKSAEKLFCSTFHAWLRSQLLVGCDSLS